jgi:hypothetical protein
VIDEVQHPKHPYRQKLRGDSSFIVGYFRIIFAPIKILKVLLFRGKSVGKYRGVFRKCRSWRRAAGSGNAEFP